MYNAGVWAASHYTREGHTLRSCHFAPVLCSSTLVTLPTHTADVDADEDLLPVAAGGMAATLPCLLSMSS